MVCVILINHYVLSAICKCCAHIVWDVIIPYTRVPDVQHTEWTGTKIRGSHRDGGPSAAEHGRGASPWLSESMAGPSI